MALAPPIPIKERILVMGSFGTGKTFGWLKVAEWMARTGSPGHVYVLDTDSAAYRMLNPKGQFAHLLDSTVTVAEVHEWKQYEAALDNLLPVLKPEDWLVIDFIGSAWDAVQDWYTETIYHTDMAEFFLQARKNMETGSPLDGWKDWSVINRVYRRWVDKNVHRVPSHVYMTAVVDTLRETDSAEARATFGKFMVKPRGQKHLAHQVHTVLLAQSLGDEWYLNTIKDRERPILEGVRVNDFAVDYLVNTAGWTL